MKHHGIQVAHKSTSTLQKLASKPERSTEVSDHTHVVYKVQCTNSLKNITWMTGKKNENPSAHWTPQKIWFVSLVLVGYRKLQSCGVTSGIHEANYPSASPRVWIGDHVWLRVWTRTWRSDDSLALPPAIAKSGGLGSCCIWREKNANTCSGQDASVHIEGALFRA